MRKACGPLKTLKPLKENSDAEGDHCDERPAQVSGLYTPTPTTPSRSFGSRHRFVRRRVTYVRGRDDVRTRVMGSYREV